MDKTELNNEEQEILDLIAKHERGEELSASPDTRLLSLIAKDAGTIVPDREFVSRLTAALPAPHSPLAVESPYLAAIMRMVTSTYALRLAAPVAVILLVVGVVLGVNGKKRESPVIVLMTAPTQEEAPLSIAAQPATFASLERSDNAAPGETMMMAKMARTTVASATPQNVGELIALLAVEADDEVSVGTTDLDDPLYSADDAFDAIQHPYDATTI